MQWSKLKSRMKSRICPELRDRIDFHVTSYRHSHDDADNVWITIDGEILFSYKYYPYQRAAAEAFFCGLKGNEIKTALREMEIHSPQDLGTAMRRYLDVSIESALESSNSLIRAFAIIDRRVGRRRLAKLEVSEMDHPLVKAFFLLRLAETKSS